MMAYRAPDRKKPHTPIAEKMAAYAADGALAFHTPGHKQGKGAHEALRKLITAEGLCEEVSLMEELDDIHSPSGCIKEAEELAARLYGAKAAYFMVNGTSGAIHTMLLAALSPGDTVLVQRNAHRSVYSALVLLGARPIYLAPEVDERLGIAHGVAPATIVCAIQRHPEARAAVLVNPTYYGITTELDEIAEYLHNKGRLLLVDEAHGPHLAFCDRLPQDAIAAGADMAAQSTHKILGAMTQGSLLLANGDHVDYARIRETTGILTTTSPNQLLLASIDIARLQMEESGREAIERATALAEKLRQDINKIPGLWSPGKDDFSRAGAVGLDLTKVTVNLAGLTITAIKAEKVLRHSYKVQCELSDPENLLFILSYADSEKETAVLLAALKDLAQKYLGKGKEQPCTAAMPPLPKTKMTPREAFFAERESVSVKEAAGRIAAEEITCYPPGIPALVPGDVVTEEVLRYLERMRKFGRRTIGARDADFEKIVVVK